MSAFDVFPAAAYSLEIAGVTLAITPVCIGEIPDFLTAVRPFAQQLADPDPDWLVLMADHTQDLISAVALASRQPREWVTALAVDDAIRLAAALFEVNADFFVQRVVPAIQHAAARITTKLNLPLTGLMPSNC